MPISSVASAREARTQTNREQHNNNKKQFNCRQAKIQQVAESMSACPDALSHRIHLTCTVLCRQSQPIKNTHTTTTTTRSTINGISTHTLHHHTLAQCGKMVTARWQFDSWRNRLDKAVMEMPKTETTGWKRARTAILLFFLSSYILAHTAHSTCGVNCAYVPLMCRILRGKRTNRRIWRDSERVRESAIIKKKLSWQSCVQNAMHEYILCTALCNAV